MALQINSQTAEHVLDTAITAANDGVEGLRTALDEIPAAIYVTDKDGTITYFNRACEVFAGRTPAVDEDKWCVSWKLYTIDGEPLPHDQCPMALALREGRPVRDVNAVAERPDGTRIVFTPYPTPHFDSDGRLIGAVNLLIETPALTKGDQFREQADKCRSLATRSDDPMLTDTLTLMAAKYDEQVLKLRCSG